jgi:hypothetical protein
LVFNALTRKLKIENWKLKIVVFATQMI